MAAKYRIELFTTQSRRPKIDKFFWRLLRGREVLAPSEGLTNRKDRDAVAGHLAAALGANCSGIKDLNPPAVA